MFLTSSEAACYAFYTLMIVAASAIQGRVILDWMWARRRPQITRPINGVPGAMRSKNCAKTPFGIYYGELKRDPFWEPLRQDPRYNKLLAELAPKD